MGHDAEKPCPNTVHLKDFGTHGGWLKINEGERRFFPILRNAVNGNAGIKYKTLEQDRQDKEILIVLQIAFNSIGRGRRIHVCQGDMRRVGEFFGLKANRINKGGADGTMKREQRRISLHACPQDLWFSFELESSDSADGNLKGVGFHLRQNFPNYFIVSRREFSKGIQRQVHFLASSKSHTWMGAWLYRNEAIFCLIGERKDKEIAWHGRHL